MPATPKPARTSATANRTAAGSQRPARSSPATSKIRRPRSTHHRRHVRNGTVGEVFFNDIVTPACGPSTGFRVPALALTPTISAWTTTA